MPTSSRHLLTFVNLTTRPDKRNLSGLVYYRSKYIAMKGIIMKVIATANAPAAIGPYSQALVVGNLVLTSGQVGIDLGTGKLPEGLEAQVHQVFKNIAAILDAAGTDMSKVVKATVFIKDMNDFGKVNEIYAKYFTEPFPARSCIEVARLPKDALIECEVIAEL